MRMGPVVKMSDDDIAMQLRLMPVLTNLSEIFTNFPGIFTGRPCDSLRVEKGVLVLCGSRSGARQSYTAEAGALGEYIARRSGVPLVYGGGTQRASWARWLARGGGGGHWRSRVQDTHNV